MWEKQFPSRFGAYNYKSEEDPTSPTSTASTPQTNGTTADTPSTTLTKREPATLTQTPQQQQERFARELDQWLRKMRCSGATGTRLDSFRDIKVGVCPDPVKRGAPSMEPYPSRYREQEEYTFRGGRNAQGNFQGRGVVEFENGDLVRERRGNFIFLLEQETVV